MQIAINDTQLYYETHGQGQPLLMMHGGLGLDHTYFPPFFNPLGDQCELVYYDHRGHVRSAELDSWDGVTRESLADDANALRQALGHEQVVLFGHSYGGFLAQEYALRHGDTLKGLILCATSSNISDYHPAIPEWATPEQLTAFGEVFGGPMKDDADWRAHWTTIWPLYFRQYDAELAASIDATTIYRGAAWNHGAGLLASYNTKERLNEITVPTLILTGRHDFIIRPGYAEDMHQAIPNSELVILEDSGHYPFVAETDKFMDVVRSWLAKLA